MRDILIEADRCLRALETSGILGPLRTSGGPGVVGSDGEEYPVPTVDQMRKALSLNEELVERKEGQGFTGVLLTPMAMPVHLLIGRVNAVVRTKAGSILRTKRDPGDPDLTVEVSKKEPVWIWERVRQAQDTPEVVYFPASYDRADHQGMTKEEVVRDPRVCTVPGWSFGLVEPIPVMPRRGEGEVVGGRRQLEAGSTPTEYLELLATSPYRGETGWTLEDLLTHFIVQLELTCEVSHDRSDGNALWLLGTFMPDSMRNALLVPTANWASHAGRRMYLGAHRTNNRVKDAVGRSMVRLVGGLG